MENNLLGKIVDTHVDDYYKNHSMDEEEKREYKRQLKQLIINKIENDVCDNKKEEIEKFSQRQKIKLIEEAEKEKKRIIEEGRREIEKSKMIQAIEKAKTLLRDGIIVAFIVGLLVNQVTELILPMKKGVSTAIGLHEIVITIGLGCLLLWAISEVIKKVYYDKVEKFISNIGDGDGDSIRA